MPLVSDNFHENKLKKLKINIRTKYIVGNNILERNTNNSVNDDIDSGIRCEKEYYLDNKLIHKEKIFDSRIEYTFINKKVENEKYVCSNCGMESEIKEFIDGCPYCKTYYNIDYLNKDLGSKYHYDRVLKNNKYRIITAFIDLIVSMIISYIFIKTTSRTFNSYDVTKVIIYGIILSLILFYLFYILDAYIILGPIKRYKDLQNQKQIDFWNKIKIDKKTFFNNFNYEIRKYYYTKSDIIDFDVLDYLEFEDFIKDKNQYIKVTAEIRIIKYNLGRISSETIKTEYIMKKNNSNKLELKDGVNMIKCHNCGASIDITKGKCDYCQSEIKYFQEWILEKNNL